MLELWNNITAGHRVQFPDATVSSACNHMGREIEETKKSTTHEERRAELVDVMFLFMQAVDRSGLTWTDVSYLGAFTAPYPAHGFEFCCTAMAETAAVLQLADQDSAQRCVFRLPLLLVTPLA